LLDSDEEESDDDIAEVNHLPNHIGENPLIQEEPAEVNNEQDEVPDNGSDAVDPPVLDIVQEEAVPNHRYNLRKNPRRRAWDDNYVFSTYNIKKGIELYGAEAIESMTKEMTQLHQKGVFKPVHYESLTPKQKVRTLRSMMNLKRKRSGLLKSRFLADGSAQLRHFSAIDPSSPTVSTEALFITAAIDAQKARHC